MLKALIIFLCPIMAFAEIMIGTATSNGKFLYQELHDVSYTDQTQTEIAKIMTDYTFNEKKIGFRHQEFISGHYIPNLVFKDERPNETYSITVNGLVAVLRTFFKGSEKSMEFKITKDQVTTDSIAKYIYDNFDALLKSSRIVKCLVPRSLSFVALKISKQKVTDGFVTFSVQPHSILLKLFSSQTLVTFDVKTKYWKQYQGFSNLKDKAGKMPEVQINYQIKKNLSSRVQ